MSDFFNETIQPLWQSAQFDNLLVFTDVARYGGVLVDDVAAEMFEVLGESEEEVKEDVAAEDSGEVEGDLYGKQEAGEEKLFFERIAVDEGNVDVGKGRRQGPESCPHL